MTPLDALGHLLNLFAPALGIGLWASLLTKLVFRRDLQGVGWLRLAGWAVSGSTVALAGALIVGGRDGKMANYGAMVAGCALCLWWVGWRRQ